MTNPHDRSWLQTGGMPVEPVHAIMRRELDATDSVEWIGGGCFKLRSRAGAQIGIVQFQARAEAVDDRVLQTIASVEAGEEPVAADPSKGDTVVRPLDMDNPEHRAMAQRLMTAPVRDAVIGDDGAPIQPTTPPVIWSTDKAPPLPQHSGGMPRWLASALIIMACAAVGLAVALLFDVYQDSSCRTEAMELNRSVDAC